MFRGSHRIRKHTACLLAGSLALMLSGRVLAEESPLAANCHATIHYPWPPATQPVLQEARSLVKEGKPEAAILLLNKSDIDGANLDLLATHALTLNVLGRHEEALSEIEQLLHRDPQYAWGKVYRAVILLKLDRTDEALAYINEALRNTDAEQEKRLLGVRIGLHMKNGDFTAAITDSSALIEKDPTALHHQQRAYACLQANLYEAAIVDCNEAIAREPGHIDARLVLAMVYSMQGKTRLVCDVLAEACDTEKQHLSAARGFAQYVHKTEAVVECLTPDEMRQVADHYFDLACKSSPEVVEHGHYLKGQIYLKTGDLEVAEKHLLIAQGLVVGAEPQAKIRLALEDIRQRKAAKR